MTKYMPSTGLAWIALTFVFAMLAIRVADPTTVTELRNSAFDRYQQIKPREYTAQPVRIIDIDEESLRRYGQWPWPRTRIAELVNRLADYGVATTGFDIVFAEEDRLSPSNIIEDNNALPEDLRSGLAALPDNEEALKQAMLNHRVVLGETTARDPKDTSEKEKELEDASHARIGEDPTPYIQKWPEIVENLPILNEASSGRGVFSIKRDADGIIRNVPLVVMLRGKVRLALSAETLRVATGSDSFAIHTNVSGLEGITVAGKKIETDHNGNIWPYFTEKRSDRYVPVHEILEGKADPKLLKGHIALLGISAVGLEDIRPIPLGTLVPGVEIHAQVIENLLSDSTLFRPFYSLLYEIAIILVLSLIMLLTLPGLGAWAGFVFSAALLISATASSWFAFSSYRILLDPTWPALTGAGLFLIIIISNFMREEQKRRQIRDAFGQYLSPALVGRLTDNPDALVLGGETRELSVLFTDIRGFTTISESYKDYPQGLTQLMNRFLTELSRPILERNGTIDKYMGDAIMAFWNAPFDLDDHAREACLAALEMLNNIETLNTERKAKLENDKTETYHEINVGIGINTGLCVVGNMGSENRFDYTALGDTVNIASRLEGQSKPYGLPIVIGPETAERVIDELAVFEIDLIRVKGKNEPVRIFTLSGNNTLATSEPFLEFQETNRHMLSSYRNQEWKDAKGFLKELHVRGKQLDLPIDEYILIYETRISEFEKNPPTSAWDGVYIAASK